MPVVDVQVSARQANRNSAETDTQDLSSLAATLTRVQHIASTSTDQMARKIGFAVGTQLAFERRKAADINSDLKTLFRRLSLGKVTIRQWGPVVFATHDGSGENPQTAFGEGVLEGIMHAWSRDRVFFKHSMIRARTRKNRSRARTQNRLRRSRRI